MADETPKTVRIFGTEADGTPKYLAEASDAGIIADLIWRYSRIYRNVSTKDI